MDVKLQNLILVILFYFPQPMSASRISNKSPQAVFRRIMQIPDKAKSWMSSNRARIALLCYGPSLINGINMPVYFKHMRIF